MAHALLRAGRTLHLDRVAAEVVGALAAEGVPSILLKGPVVAARLYDAGSERTYRDCDVLIDPAQVAEARGVLARLGFHPVVAAEAASPFGAVHGEALRRPDDAAVVDLHWSLADAGAPPAAVWAALHPRARPMDVGRGEVRVPDDPSLALVVLLHLLHHGTRVDTHVMRDAELALSVFGPATWREAALLAAQIDAARELGTALRLAGATGLAEALGLTDDPVRRALAAHPDGAGGELIERITRLPTVRARMRATAYLLHPPREYLEQRRRVHKLDDGGRSRRSARLLRRLPASLLAWHRARRAGGGA